MPKVAKRPAVAAASRASVSGAKRARTSSAAASRASVGGAKTPRNQVSSQCKDVVAALKNAEGLSASLRSMLMASVAPTLSQYKDLRHEHQNTVVGWIDEALAAHQSHLERCITEAKTKLDAAAEEAGTHQAAVGAAQDGLVQVKEAAADAEAKSLAVQNEMATSTAALNSAKDAEVALDEEVNAATAQKQILEAIVSDDGAYAKMKIEVSKKKNADAFVKSMKKHNFEATLLQTLAPVLVKEPATRTEFDNLVLKNLEEAVAGHVAAQAKVIEEAAPVKQERAATTAAAEAAVATMKAAADTANATLTDLQAVVKSSEVVLKDATKAAKACGPVTKAAASDVKEAESAVEEFGTGPLAVFKQLRDRCTPVEEPAVAEDAPAADDPAADDAPAPADAPAAVAQSTDV